ncbi:MAG: hypothetical protein B7Z37_30830 [Verrucomicrobia bacterium 12-59-8]|nr:MAG: hypothetical protein B7Z37_30830 [Verrucomicrobia bacterium 12-59-8]
MGIFGNLFRKGEEPNKTWADPILGQTEWSDDDEAWCGEFEGFQFTISYEWTREPDPALVEYAREILRSREWLIDTLIREKANAKSEYGDDLSSEIDRQSMEQSVSCSRRRRESFLPTLEMTETVVLGELNLWSDLAPVLGSTPDEKNRRTRRDTATPISCPVFMLTLSSNINPVIDARSR